ncbi:MAG TPA: glycoside hydrolase family 9 protein [Planctomycetota bacterium]|nr:glycoside hydrolase family 9 protein [Planctomycetota bacterium]
MRAAVIAWIVMSGVSAGAADAAAPLPEGVTASAANLGPADGAFRLDVTFPTVSGCDAGLMDVQVVHASLVIVGNDYTAETRAAARAARKAELDAIAAKKINAWSKFKETAAVFEPAFVAAYDQPERLDQATFFTIGSADDPRYAARLQPARVTRYAMPRGNFREFVEVRGRECTAGTLLANFSYVFLPQPMERGRSYTITQGDGRAITFLFHEDLTVSRALKVNQTGYAPGVGRKFAYLGAWHAGIGPVDLSAWDGKRFAVVDADTRAVVHEGRIALVAKDPTVAIQKQERPGAGEDIYELDLSALTARGEFYIRVDGLGRSWAFKHHPDAIGRAFWLHLRGLFHQRAGHELTASDTGWPRPLAHAAAYDADYAPESSLSAPPVKPFNAIDAHIKAHPHQPERAPTGRGGVGGWYDAADFDRRWYHYDTIFDLLLAYELNRDVFSDGQAATYDAGNRIPDILDEVAYGLLVWRNSQDDAGGVAGHCEQRCHPNSLAAMPTGRPHHDPERMFFSARTRGMSLSYAGPAAHLARLIEPFAPEQAAAWLASATRAYAFGMDEANHYQRDDYLGSGKPYRESDELIAVTGCAAALQLYLATREAPYLERAIALYPTMKPHLKWPLRFVHQDYWWAFGDDGALPAPIRDEVRRRYLAAGDQVEARTHERFYRSPIDQRSPWPTTWGKAAGTPDARALVMAYGLDRAAKFRDAIALACDWVQGCNPLGLSWTSGVGSNYPWCFFSGESEEDGIVDPVPGITVYGVTGGIPMGARRAGFNLMAWDGQAKTWSTLRRLQPDYVAVRDDDLCPHIPYWRGWVMDYHDAPEMQEYTVNETISPCVLAYAALLEPGWMPGPTLTGMKPRDPRFIVGLWPTP